MKVASPFHRKDPRDSTTRGPADIPVSAREPRQDAPHYQDARDDRSESVYLDGYSGRVVLVNESGDAVRAYDIGSVPRRIVETEQYLYLPTDTRLYVLRGDALHTLIDTFDGGELVVAQTGLGLLEKKRLRWFRDDGAWELSCLRIRFAAPTRTAMD